MLSVEQQRKLELLRLRRKYKLQLNDSFDPYVIESRPTPAQKEIMSSEVRVHYIVSANRSGKTQLISRIAAWWFNESHPFLVRPERWGDKPIKIIFMGQSQENLENEIWPSKVAPFLGDDGVDYKVKRSGGYIKSVRNLHNNNTIIFMTHSDAEQARRRGQGFTAHIAIIDEMPPLSSILTELRLRVLTENGWMYCGFTPLIRNDNIRKIVDASDGVRSLKSKLSILDNPAFTEEEREGLVAEFRAISGSEGEFRARLYGDWITAGDLVYYYDSDRSFAILDGYDPRIWPHVAVVDPAHSGLAGLTVWAREPKANRWYCVKAKYLNGQAPSDLVNTVEDEISPFNVIARKCDCNPAAFYKEAYKMGVQYTPISDKHYNKENMIADYNQAMVDEKIKFTSGAQPLIDEMMTCTRHEQNPTKIMQASKYHTADSAVYFVQFMPKFKEEELPITHHQWIKQRHHDREVREYKQKRSNGPLRLKRGRRR